MGEQGISTSSVGHRVAAVLIVAAFLALPSAAGAASNYTWTGTGFKVVKVYNEEEAINGKPKEKEVGSDLWSTASNWEGGITPSGFVGALIFPELTNPACKPPSFEEESLPCYRSDDDIPGVSANAMFLALGGFQTSGMSVTPEIYNVRGKETLALGEGGLTASPQASASAWSEGNLELPLDLSAPQTWSISGNGENEGILEVNGPVSGESNSLEVSLNNGVLAAGADLEAGPITITGGGSVSLGNPRGPHYVGILNGQDGAPVTVGEGIKVIDENTNNFVNGRNSIGALTVSDFSTLKLGQPEFAAGVTLGVNGGVSLSPASKLALLYNSHIHSTGPVDLDEAQLVMEDGFSLIDGTPTCNVLAQDTLISTTGQLTGTFRGLPDGALLPLDCEGLRNPPEVRINYTAHTVTATLIQRTATALSISNAAPSAGQQVTYTAIVTPQRQGEGVPSGSVEFRDGSQPIGGCSAQPLIGGEETSTANCTVSYSAVGSHTISTSYLGSPDFASSSSPGQGVTVQAQAPPPKKKMATAKCKGKRGKAKARCLRKVKHHSRANHRHRH